jgi:hypothetical protein
VQQIVSETVIQITAIMMKALMETDQTDAQGFKSLAERHVLPNLEQDINGCSTLTQKIYKKVFQATLEHIRNYSPPLRLTLEIINSQMRDPSSSGKFLGSFVYLATTSLIDRLDKEQPDARRHEEIWD